MNNVICIQLKKDIDKEKKLYVRKQLVFLQEKMGTVALKINTELTIEDSLIIVSDYEEYLEKLYNGTYDEEIGENIKLTKKYLEKYYKLTNYNGEIVNSGKLSNGVYFYDFEKETILYNKAIQSRNKIATIVKTIAAICFIVSFLVFFALIFEENLFSFPVLIGSWIGSLLIYCLGEIVQLLHDIRRKLYRK